MRRFAGQYGFADRRALALKRLACLLGTPLLVQCAKSVPDSSTFANVKKIMKTIQRIGLAAAAASFFLASCMGCANQASFTALRPAEMNVEGVNSLIVVDFRGLQPHAEMAQAATVAQLYQAQFFRVVDRAEWERVLPPSPYAQAAGAQVDRAVDAGRRMGVDAVLVADVKPEVNWGADLGNSAFRLGDPRSTVTIDAQLVDVRTGRVRSNYRVARTIERKIDHEGKYTEENILAGLAERCGSLVAGKLVPHEQTIDVKLSRIYSGNGANEIRKGIGAAQEGRWDKARELWQAAVAKDPKNDAALYNLGVAHEALGQFDRARQCYAQAAGINEKSKYAEAIGRVDKSSQDYHVAMAQKQQKMNRWSHVVGQHMPPHNIAPAVHGQYPPAYHPAGAAQGPHLAPPHAPHSPTNATWADPHAQQFTPQPHTAANQYEPHGTPQQPYYSGGAQGPNR